MSTPADDDRSPGEPLNADGSIPAFGTLGRWLTSEKDVAGSDYKARDVILGKVEGKKETVEDLLLTGFPRNWPAPFKESAELKRLLKTNLRGTRVRAIEPSAETDTAAKKAAVPLHNLHGFSNATRLHEALGWKIVKGFVVYEMLDKPAG